METLIKALSNHYRYNYKGVISTEDLFDLTIEELDRIYCSLTNELNKLQGGLIGEDSQVKTVLRNKIEIVKTIFTYKENEINKRKEYMENKAKKQRIMEILEKKKDDSLNNMSAGELEELLRKL